MSNALRGNQIGPRQFEFPPNRPVSDSPGVYFIGMLRPATSIVMPSRCAAEKRADPVR